SSAALPPVGALRLPTTPRNERDALREESRTVPKRIDSGAEPLVYWTYRAGERTAKMTLQEQLTDLRRAMARIDHKYAALQPRQPDPRAFIEALISGQVVETPHGRHFETEKLYAAHRRYGSFDIGNLIDLSPDLLSALSENTITGVPPN